MDEVTKRPFAVFDIDGTLIRWQLYHAITDKLARSGHIPKSIHQKAADARMVWKRREHAESFHAYELALIEAYHTILSTLTKEAFMQAVHEVFDQYKDQTYIYTRDLVRQLQKQNYLLFAISGSQTEIIEILANYYGFDDFGGSIYEYKNGKFTGNEYVMRRDEKPHYLAKLVEKHNATYTDSLGIGDSSSDIPILEAVARPIAFNPDRALFKHAQTHKWSIVVERKNMIYKMEPDNGSYLLA